MSRLSLSALGFIAVAFVALSLLLVAVPALSGVGRLLIVISLIACGVTAVASAMVWRRSERLAREIRVLARAASEPTPVRADLASELGPIAEAIEALLNEARAANTRASAERSRILAILTTLTDGVIVLDGDGSIELANDAASRHLGIDRPYLAGKRLVEVTTVAPVLELAEAFTKRGVVGSRTVEILPARRYLRVMALPLRAQDPGTRRGRVLLVIRDISDLQRTEVTRREFVSNASHELRTPLAAIRASAETLQGGALSDRAAASQFVERIVADATRMERMLGEMLELSRLESGHLPLHLVPLKLEAQAAEVVDQFQPVAVAKGVALRVEPPSETLPFAMGDPGKLQQVLGNLIDNALKATSPGGKITVSVREIEFGVELKVVDTGRGIDPIYLPHVFERFYRGDRAPTDGGVGLGLAIAKHIVQAHGGELTAASEVGQGSTFTMRIPVRGGREQATSGGRQRLRD